MPAQAFLVDKLTVIFGVAKMVQGQLEDDTVLAGEVHYVHCQILHGWGPPTGHVSSSCHRLSKQDRQSLTNIRSPQLLAMQYIALTVPITLKKDFHQSTLRYAEEAIDQATRDILDKVLMTITSPVV